MAPRPGDVQREVAAEGAQRTHVLLHSAARPSPLLPADKQSLRSEPSVIIVSCKDGRQLLSIPRAGKRPLFCFFQSCSLYPSWLPIYLPLGSTSATDQHCTLCSQALGALGLSSLIYYCTNFAPDIQEPHLAPALSTFSLPVPAGNPLGTPSITAFPDLQQKLSLNCWRCFSSILST